MNLFDELTGLVTVLDAAGVEYALAGGLAVAVWGVPRATQDIDLLVPAAALAPALDAVGGVGFATAALPMRFADGMEVRRVGKDAGDELLTLDLILVHPGLGGGVGLPPAGPDRGRRAVGRLPGRADPDEAGGRSAPGSGRRPAPPGRGPVIGLPPALSAPLVTARLRQASALAELQPARRLDAKVGLDAAAVSRRLRQASDLQALCARLGRLGRVGPTPGGGPAPGAVSR